MSIFADLVLVAIIALCGFIGYKQGLIKAAIKIAAFLIAIIVALMLYKPVSTLVINNTRIDDNIKNTIIEKITPEGMKKEDKVTSTANISQKIVDTTNNSIENIAGTLTNKIIEIVVLLLLFVSVRIILIFVTALSNLITKIPILKQFNEVGGLIYGLIKGLLIIYVILGILLMCEPLLGNSVPNLISSSIVTKFIYNNNILVKLIF